MTARKARRTTADLLGDPPAPASRPGGQPVAHRQRLVNAQAELAEIRAKRLRGELIPAADVNREWASICADVRQRLLATPSRCAGQGMPKKFVLMMDAEIRAALEALAGQDGDSDAGRR